MWEDPVSNSAHLLRGYVMCVCKNTQTPQWPTGCGPAAAFGFRESTSSTAFSGDSTALHHMAGRMKQISHCKNYSLTTRSQTSV